MSSREAVNTYFRLVSLTRLGIKSESAAPVADVLSTRPSELLKSLGEPSVAHPGGSKPPFFETELLFLK